MTTQRPSKIEYMLAMCFHVATRATCEEAKVGCVITNSNFHIVATGYNGGLPGAPECNGKENCKVVRKSATAGISKFCPTVHAEINAINQYRQLYHAIELPPDNIVFTTLAPCYSCAQQLKLAGAKTIYFVHSNSWYESYKNRPYFLGMKFHQVTLTQLTDVYPYLPTITI